MSDNPSRGRVALRSAPDDDAQRVPTALPRKRRRRCRIGPRNFPPRVQSFPSAGCSRVTQFLPARVGSQARIREYSSRLGGPTMAMQRLSAILLLVVAMACPAVFGAGRTATGSGALQSDAAIDLKVVIPQLL